MLPEALVVIFVLVLGLSLGSFLNVVIYRLPRPELSLGRPARSFCPRCRTPIRWYDNLPLLGWLLLGGRCRACRTAISWRYPAVELAAGLLALAVFYRDGLNFRAACDLYFVLALLAISLIDLELMIIPDHLTVPGMILGLLAAAMSPQLGLSGPWLHHYLAEWGWSLRWSSLTGSFLGLLLGGGSIWLVGFLYRLWRGQEGIGGGDLTLLAMIGAFLGWRSVPLVAFGASIFGLMAAVPVLLRQPAETSPEDHSGADPAPSLETALEAGPSESPESPTETDSEELEEEGGLRLPFGPFLSLAALLYLFFGERFWAWYLPA